MIKENFENKIKRYANYIRTIELNTFLFPYLEYIARCFIVRDFRWVHFNIHTLLNAEPDHYRKYKQYVERIIYLSNYTLEHLFNSLKVEMFHSSTLYFFDNDLKQVLYYRVSSTNNELKNFFSYHFFIVYSISENIENSNNDYEIWHSFRMCLHQNIVKCNSLIYQLYPKTYSNLPYKKYDFNSFRVIDLNQYPTNHLFTITNEKIKNDYTYRDGNTITLGNFVEDYYFDFVINKNNSIIMGKYLENSIKSTCKNYFDIFQNAKITINDMITLKHLQQIEENIDYRGLHQNMHRPKSLINDKDKLKLICVKNDFVNYVIGDNGIIKYQYKPKIFSI